MIPIHRVRSSSMERDIFFDPESKEVVVRTDGQEKRFTVAEAKAMYPVLAQSMTLDKVVRSGVA